MSQPSFTFAQDRFERPPAIDGDTFHADRDGSRLGAQLAAVTAIMQDGQWHTLSELCAAIPGASEAGISARLRDLRKVKFGGHVVERAYVTNGLWRYRMGGQ